MSSCSKCGDRRRSAKRVLALQGHELDPYEQMPDDQIQELEHNQFIDLVDNVLFDLERMEAAVKRRQELYDRLRKVRLADMLAANQGKIAEATEMLFQLTEVQGSVSWANVVKTLKKAKPELDGLLVELEEQHRGKPSSRVLKYRRKDEPKTWKQLEHVPLRHSTFRQAQGVELDEMAEYRMLRHMGQTLDALIIGLEVAMRGGMQMVAARRPNAYDEYEYDHLVDDIHDIEDQIEQLEEMGDTSGRIEDLWEDLQDAEEMLRRYRYDSGGRV